MIKSHFIRIMLSFYHFSAPVINLSFSVSLPFYFQYHRLYVISFPSQFSSYFLLLLISWSCNTARKTIFSFSKCSERMVFPRNSRWNMITLVLSGKLIFLFPENIFLFFRRKMKDDISQKNTWKCDIFFKCSEKMVFPKKIALEHDLSCFIIWKMIFLFPENIVLFFRRKMMIFLKKVHGNIFSSNVLKRWSFQKKSCWNMIFLVLSGKVVFFAKKIWYFFFGQNMKDYLSQVIHGNMIFSVYMYKCYNYDILLLQKKIKDNLLPKNYT